MSQGLDDARRMDLDGEKGVNDFLLRDPMITWSVKGFDQLGDGRLCLRTDRCQGSDYIGYAGDVSIKRLDQIGNRRACGRTDPC